MSRRNRAEKREILPDPKFGSELLAKFMNMIMEDGKKSVAERIVYGALDNIAAKKKGEEALDILKKGLDNVRPMVEVKSRRVGGATYQVPVEVRPVRQTALAMRDFRGERRIGRSGSIGTEERDGPVDQEPEQRDERLDAFGQPDAARPEKFIAARVSKK